MQFELVVHPDMETIRQIVQECEGKHVQQVVYSTFMDSLTQVCFGCQKVRTTYHPSYGA